MKTALCVKGEITEDRRLLVDLPPELPSGRVLLTLELVGEDDLEVTDEDLQGLGLTAEEIAASPEIGAWGKDPEISDGAEYVENLRRARSLRRFAFCASFGLSTPRQTTIAGRCGNWPSST